MTQLNIWLDALRAHNCDPQKAGSGYKAKCPAHDDHNPSLSLYLGKDGEWWPTCHTGCDRREIKKVLGLWTEANGNGNGGKFPQRRPDVVFEYPKADGLPSFEVWRWNNPNGSLDTIRPVKPPFRGVEDSRYPKGKHVLFNLPELRERSETPVLVTEGEKSALAAQILFPSCMVTTSAGGSGSYAKSDWGPLAGRDVTIWPDNDLAGIKYAHKVRAVLLGMEASVKVVQVLGVGLPPKWDLADPLPTGLELGDLFTNYMTDDEFVEADAADQREATKGKPVYTDANATSVGSALEKLGLAIKSDDRNQTTTYKLPDGTWSQQGGATVRNEIREKALLNGTSEGYRPFKMSDSDWRVAQHTLSQRNRYDPFIEMVEALPPVDEDDYASSTLLDDHFGVVYPADRPLAAWAVRYIIVGMVQRAYEPGCQLDEVPILVGEQDTGKSSFLESFFAAQHRDLFKEGLDLNASDKRKVEALQGAALVELGEMSGVTNAGLDHLKAFITRKSDGNVRLTYRTDPAPMYRRCIFVGTANTTLELPDDPSGNRRFVPITLGTPDKPIEPLMEYLRDGLLAEGLARYRAGERANLPRSLKKLAAAAAARYRAKHEYMESGIDNLQDTEGAKDGLSLREIADRLSLGDRSKNSKALPNSLRTLGWYEKRVRKDGKQGRCWFPPEEAEQGFLT